MPQTSAAPPGLDARLRFLAATAAAACPSRPVPPVETHMSWVFFAGDEVLKLKKPVRHAFLDFSTPAAREASCREELRLNRRLAPGVYRGLAALLWRDGAFALVPEEALPASARPVDWLVRMERLPETRMLDRRIARGEVAQDDIDALAALLCGFYRTRPPLAIAPGDYLGRFRRERATDREVLLHPGFGLPQAAAVLDRFDAALARHAGLLGGRAAQGRLVEGHGDLRPEHVCLRRPPVVIDALEFNARLRELDPFDELSFLGLECTVAGAPWIGPRLVGACAAALGDVPPAALLALYTAHRALLRARLALAHLLDPQPRLPRKWPPAARRYLGRAHEALDALDAPLNGRP